MTAVTDHGDDRRAGPLAGGGQYAAPAGGVAGIGTGRLWLKAEWLNPGGSVKDRAARAILRDALRRGSCRAGACSMPRAATPASPTPCSARPPVST